MRRNPVNRHAPAIDHDEHVEEPPLSEWNEDDYDVVADGLVVGNDPLFNSLGKELGTLSVSHRMPAIFQYREFVRIWGSVELRQQSLRLLPTGWALRGPDTQWRESIRSSDPAVHES